MVAHRALAQVQGAGDVGDGAAALDLTQNVGLTLRQGRGSRREGLERQALINRASARGYRAHAVGQGLNRCVLHHKARGTRVEGALQVPRASKRRHDQHPHARETSADRLSRRDAVHARHFDVNDRDVGGGIRAG